MPKTKQQKREEVEQGIERLKDTSTLILTDFTGLTANGMNALRKSLREAGMRFRVIKKRLFGRMCDAAGIGLNREEIKGQLGVVFSRKDVVETARPLYAFQKANKDVFKILGGVEVAERKILAGETVIQIGGLPSRDVLIAQVIGMFAAPIRSFLYVLNEKARKGA